MLSAEAVAVRARAAADLAERARTHGQWVTGLPTAAVAGAVPTDRHPQTRSGRREAACELDGARRTAELLGARPLKGAIESLAAASRLRLDGGAEARVAGPAAIAAEVGLTPRELEIVPLLVAGRTNAEIADALVISPRTVGVHVSQILHKLGAAQRTEAADIARRRGLVSG